MDKYKKYNVNIEEEMRRDGYFEYHSSLSEDEDVKDGEEENKNVYYPQGIYPQSIDIMELIEYRKKLKFSYTKH